LRLVTIRMEERKMSAEGCNSLLDTVRAPTMIDPGNRSFTPSWRQQRRQACPPSSWAGASGTCKQKRGVSFYKGSWQSWARSNPEYNL
jgi:hypothetical protein